MSDELIKKLSEQIDAAQLVLDELRKSCGSDAFEGCNVEPSKRHEIAQHTAIRAFNDRRARDQHFSDPEVFGEPAWDILLDLYIH